ncbi:MAG: hypothetical protein KDD40_05370, partial [Bdellovibrionales bacterium]|nr:hypothetical protein [Bdellovibrionales bacterium]
EKKYLLGVLSRYPENMRDKNHIQLQKLFEDLQKDILAIKDQRQDPHFELFKYRCFDKSELILGAVN